VAGAAPYSLLSVIFNLVFVKDTKAFSTLSTDPMGHVTALWVWWEAAGHSPTFTIPYNIYVIPEWR